MHVCMDMLSNVSVSHMRLLCRTHKKTPRVLGEITMEANDSPRTLGN